MKNYKISPHIYNSYSGSHKIIIAYNITYKILGQESKSLQIQDSNILTGQNFIENKFSC